MRAVWIGITAALSLWAQDDFHVYSDPPRLFLTPQRLRLLERERDRESLRWQYFDSVADAAAEPGFAQALYYRISRLRPQGRKAVDWALSDAATDLRQLALVYDWCGELLTPAEADRLGAKIQRALNGSAATVTTQSARALAAIAIADRLPDSGHTILAEIVAWWRAQPPTPRGELYPLFELLHAIRDNTKVELRERAPDYFTTLPLDYIAGFYPASFPGPQNDLRIPVFTGNAEPDPLAATRARAAGLAMVALDTNAVNYQFVQGMLMLDRFILRDPLGAPYEFLWANPYQPGLAYQTLPRVFHDPTTGHVFARTSWDEDATWIGYFDGALQLFRNGGIQTVRRGAPVAPIPIGDTLLTVPADPARVQIRFEGRQLFVIGLAPKTEYAVEIDDQELDLLQSDVTGTLIVSSYPDTDAEVRIVPHKTP